MALPPAPAITGYETLSLLGSGQYGDVFLVRRTRDSQLFAAKVPNHARGNPLQLAQATQEAELLKRMRHVNITQCIETAEDAHSGQLAIIMEYASGGDLDEYLRSFQDRQRVMSEAEVMRIFMQIALALEYLHSHRILHRDLKPKNILLDANGIVKVSDFGVSRMLQNSLDAAQTVIGTPYYMSPELMDDQPYDAKSDVWSLGCVVYELATFAPPFKGKAIGAVVHQILNAEPTPLPACYSRGFQDLVTKLLTKNARARPDIRDVLRSEFVLHHMFQMMTVATFQQPKSLERFAAGFSTEQHQSADVAQPQPAAHYQQQLSASPAVVIPSEWFQPSNAHHERQVQHQQQQQQPRPHFQLQQQQQSQSQGDGVARQIFFENQAAARRNKERVDKDKSTPAAFMEEDDRPAHRHRDNRVLHQPSVEFQPRPKQIHDQEAAKDIARQCFLENARIAKINKQRALDAMREGSDCLPAPPVYPLPGGAEAFTSFERTLSPPPVPPVSQQVAIRKERNSASSYEEMLEAERRRVRLETKALHDRMRAIQQAQLPSTQLPPATVASQEPLTTQVLSSQ
ncbi:hypothetical protein Gpo141_00009470 [Globisporangium polare]